MVDRSPTYPGRVKLTPVAGTTDKFDLEMADEPTEVGTPLCKATLLTDATAAKYGPFRVQLSSLAVGDTISLKVNGADTDFVVVHQGKPSAMYDDSCDGTWLLMANCYESRAWNDTNVNDYVNSTIHAYLNSTFYGLFDSNTQGVIKQVKIPYVNGTGGSPVASGSNGLLTKIFLLSGYEVGFTTSVNQYFPIDGAKLDYFVSGNDSTAQAKRVANRNGSASNWWLRSPDTGDASDAWLVNSGGGCSDGGCTNTIGVRPALVLHSTKYYDFIDHNFYDSNLDPTPNDIFNAAFDKVPVVRLENVYTTFESCKRTGQTSLNEARSPASASIPGTFAFFAGGTGTYVNNTDSKQTVDAYNASLTKSTSTALSVSRQQLAGTNVGNYALFGGGYTGSAYSGVVNSYDKSATRGTASGLNTLRNNLAGGHVGNYALFGGGFNGSNSAAVDAYNASLTRSTPTELSTARYRLAAASVGNYALFGGGYNGSNSAAVDAYNASLTRNVPTALSTARYRLAAASVGNYALFGGGSISGTRSAVVDAYNASLTRSTPTELSAARTELAGAGAGDYALFGGGTIQTGSASSDIVDAYNASLTRTLTALSQARNVLSGVSIGNYVLFGGGYSSQNSAYSAIVDAFDCRDVYKLTMTIPAFSKYSISGITVGETLTLTDVSISNAESSTPFNGYIKRGFTLTGQIS